MTLNEIIMQLVLLSEHPAMPKGFQPTFQKVIESLSEMPEVVLCKDCKKHNLGIGDFAMVGKEKVWIWKPDACPLVQFRGKAEGHEFDYQCCSYGELRGDSEWVIGKEKK